MTPGKQSTTCPTCGTPIPGLLVASCRKPACLRASNDADAALDLRCED